MRRNSSVIALAFAFLLLPSWTLAKPPKLNVTTSPPSGSGGTTLSGTLVKKSSATTSWYLYPGACVQRALGTWSPKSSAVADSLQPHGSFPNSGGYTDGQPVPGSNTIAYTRADLLSLQKLWGVVDASTPAGQRPAIIDGSRSLWCGKFETGWTISVGYPNNTYQILYLDTGTHGGNYTLTFEGDISTELNYDFLHVIGGGTDTAAANGNRDPLGNRRDYFDSIIHTGSGGPDGNGHVIVTFTGSITSAQSVSSGAGTIEGNGSGQPNTVSYSISGIPDRAVYLVLVSDAETSSEDGLWPEGDGAVLDLVQVSDNGSIYNDQTAGVALDPHDGTVLTGTYGSFGCVSARTAAGVGELWQLAPGTENPTSDGCAPAKTLGSDLFFEGGEPNFNTSLAAHAAFVTCTFPIGAGNASVVAQWNRHMDLPRYSGLYQMTDYRYFKDGTWSSWKSMNLAGGLSGEGLRSWGVERAELAEAARADSVQLRFGIQCVASTAADQANCNTSILNALLYDDLRLEVTSGVPAPVLGIAPASLPQTTFIDGAQGGVNCGAAPCWPGLRGSALGTIASRNLAVHDNFNSPFGDSITIACASPLRRGGMGINWRRGFSKSVNSGELGSPGAEYAFLNASYNAAVDVPRMIFRLFDPATKTWSPWDSTELVADAVVAAAETTVIYSGYQTNWPPYDKSVANASLPGGFTVNGVSAYNGLRFLPRGARVQYYFKATDIHGGVAYRFTSDAPPYETEDLPTLPGSAIKAPDIMEFRVLPGVYAPGPAGSLLAGRTNTPLLNLDRSYGTWSFGYDPVTQALRGLGVRADRYRFLPSVVTANGIGGRELPASRIDRPGNYFPNRVDWALVDSLGAWYRILIESGHTRTVTAFDEQDAITTEEWWRSNTGTDAGDRCLFASGDNLFNLLLNTGGVVTLNQVSLAQNVFGVFSAIDNWAIGNAYPTIDDRFTGGNGVGLAAPGTFTYPVDGGCPGLNRFDALTKVGDVDAVVGATYPSGSIAAIARAREVDNTADRDLNKALGYGFSMQFIRNPSYGVSNANYTRAGVENRMRVLYRFLTGCRGTREADDLSCWPCPTPGAAVPTVPQMQAEWALQSAGFQTSTYGPLYPIQAAALVTLVEPPATPPAPFVNALGQNRPNPFNPETTIPYSLATPGRVTIRIYDIAGRLVRTLVDGPAQAGPHAVRWNGATNEGSSTASGVYFYKIEYPDGAVSSRKMILLR
ncbi:MAG TPA: FlgD immunoglobulin-like domain containing protein [Candidatus Eisenbacteria bacterium]|nr:FlgD immunoglobulin-like domain containing protein [Candidatus Eisenbacteria bacterium]